MKPVLLAALCFLHLHVIGQQQKMDSLRNIALNSKTDTARVLAYNQLSSLTKNIDSAIKYAEKGIELARTAGFENGEASCLNQLGDIFFQNSQFPQALKYYLQSLKIFEEKENLKGMAAAMTDVGNVYSRQEDYASAMQYFRNVCSIKRQLKEDERSIYFGMGKAHEFSKQLDSALIYYQRAYEYYTGSPSHTRIPFILIHLGNVHLKKKNDLLALTYARMAGNEVKYLEDSAGVSSVYTHMAEIFSETGHKDSAIMYATQSFGIATRHKFSSAIDAGLLLSNLHKGDPARQLFYYRTAKEIQDSIFSNDRRNEIQLLSFHEKQRQQEVIELKEKEAMERQHNIQFAAIGSGLILFVIVFLLLSNSIIANERQVKFLGILLLLMVFEFVNLVLHPYIGNITHHSPVLMLLAMVIIASLLIPTHHHLEKWITKKMVIKNKEARLKGAKKILSELEHEEALSK